MRTTISSGGLEATIDSFGAQLVSLVLDGREYLWQGDGRWWSGQAPVLFPIVGVLRDGHAMSAQGSVSLRRHGLARDYEHALIGQTPTSLSYKLVSNEETLALYPYAFALRMGYALEDGALVQTFEVENTGDAEMPFVVGGHPAFNAPLPGCEGAFEDHVLSFAAPWNCTSPWMDAETGLIDSSKSLTLSEGSDVLPLSRGLFAHDTLVLEDVPGSVVTLEGPSGHGVELAFEGMKYLGIWSPGDAPFVAVEPWVGTATRLDEDDMFEHKANMQFAAPGEKRRFAFSMRPF